MIIYGYRTIVRQLAMITMVCARCNSYAPQQVKRRVRKFTLFFIPLFPISRWYFTRCTACGKDHLSRKATVQQLLAQNGLALNGRPLPADQQQYGTQHPVQQYAAPQNAPAQFPAPQYPTQQYPTQQYPVQQYPTQQYPVQQYPTQQYAAPQQQYGTVPR